MAFAVQLQESLRQIESQVPASPGGASGLGLILSRYLLEIEAQSDSFILTSILLRDGHQLRHGAAPTLPDAYCAAIDGLELKNLGMNGRDLKNKAQEYLDEAKLGAPNTQMMAELEALRARNALLEEDIKRVAPTDEFTSTHGDRFDGMNIEQLREFVTTNTGQAPLGSMNRKTLLRLARDAAGTSSTKAA